MSNPNQFTVGWIDARRLDGPTAKTFLDEVYETPKVNPINDNNSYSSYTLGRIKEHKVVIATLPNHPDRMASTAIVATNMLFSYPNLRFILLVGIGGGAPSRSHDIRLGDVVVGTGGFFQYYFSGTTENQVLQMTGALNSPSCLITATNILRSRHEMLGHEYETAIEKYRRPNQLSDKLYRSGFTHPSRNESSCEKICGTVDLMPRPERTKNRNSPIIHYGAIASGDQLIINAVIRDEVAEQKGVLCFEKEAAGIVNNYPCLVVRGISNYSDTHKNKKWEGYAGMVASAYAKNLLHEIRFEDVEAEQRILDLVKPASAPKYNTAK
ncbi:nucleoside phosphorylase domain-containing protein [Trichoderma velutinum]